MSVARLGRHLVGCHKDRPSRESLFLVGKGTLRSVTALLGILRVEPLPAFLVSPGPCRQLVAGSRGRPSFTVSFRLLSAAHLIFLLSPVGEGDGCSLSYVFVCEVALRSFAAFHRLVSDAHHAVLRVLLCTAVAGCASVGHVGDTESTPFTFLRVTSR